MAPLNILANYGDVLGYLTALIIGIGFGAVLEISGFGDSRKLAAQFYFKDMTVLKVMFTAIVVAMALIFLTTSFEITDFSKIYVNKTYLIPGIIGGLIMGVGFIIGGFCPGTSIVAASTLKIDGMFFVGGAFFGVFLFGETLPLFSDFHNSFFYGRYILPEMFNLSYGVVVFLVVLMALAMFYGGELSERIFGDKQSWKNINKYPSKVLKALGVVLIFFALIILIKGQPGVEEKWEWIKSVEAKILEERKVQIEPMELLDTMHDSMLYIKILDVRSESDFNLFHLRDSVNIKLDSFKNEFSPIVKELKDVPSNTIIVLISNDETKATTGYKLLKAQNIINLYILSGGLNQWLDTFHVRKCVNVTIQSVKKGSEKMKYVFPSAYGSKIRCADPVLDEHAPKVKYAKKIKVQKKTVISGGCG